MKHVLAITPLGAVSDRREVACGWEHGQVTMGKVVDCKTLKSVCLDTIEILVTNQTS